MLRVCAVKPRQPARSEADRRKWQADRQALEEQLARLDADKDKVRNGKDVGAGMKC